MFSGLSLWATPSILTVTGQRYSVGKYAKIEFVVGLTGNLYKSYDPDQSTCPRHSPGPPEQNGKSWFLWR